jgi:hypothetical protein
LKVKYAEPLSNSAFNFNLRCYNMVAGSWHIENKERGFTNLRSQRNLGRGLHSSTAQLNLTRFRHEIHPKHLLTPPK